MASVGTATVTIGVRHIVLSDEQWRGVRALCERAIEQLGDDPRVHGSGNTGFLQGIIDTIDGKEIVFGLATAPNDDSPSRCPKCGSEHLCVTTIGMLSGPDGNHASCMECKWAGFAHECEAAQQ